MRFTVHVHPGSRQHSVGGSYDDALSVHVRARALDGLATKETLTLLAAAFDVRPGAVACLHGAHSRYKLITIDGDDEVLERRLTELQSATTDQR